MKKGKISFYDERKDFGKIESDEGELYLFKSKNIDDGIEITPKTRVQFNVKITHAGRVYADNIQIVLWKQNEDTDNIEIIENISSWSQEAGQDELLYFYEIEEIEELQTGKKNFVIGRKGTGKTAICEYLNMPSSGVFSTKLSFQNFPFNELYKEVDTSFRQPNHYISLWKYTIYLAVINMMRNNQNLDISVRNKLDKIFEYDVEIGIKPTTTKLMSGEIRAKVLEVVDVGVSGTKETKHDDLDWAKRISILENFILKNMDHNQYYVLFDELDEDYSSVLDKEYFYLLTGLFKSIMQIRNVFGDTIVPIAFLRSDIYYQIQNPDKHKWEERLIKLQWSAEKIQKMLTYRISVASKIENIDFEQALGMIFSNPYVNGRKRKEHVFNYIQKRTFDRPRDYIYILKQSAILAKNDKREYISKNDLDLSLFELSRHIKQTIIDEVYPQCEYISMIFKIFSQIGKSTFTIKEFRTKYESYMEIQSLTDIKKAEQVLSLLYRFNVVGNLRNEGYKIFYNEEDDTDLKLDLHIIIHSAITKSLKLVS